MLNEVADGVWVRQSEWVWSNAIVVRGEAGLILVDPGIDGSDLDQLADDLDRLGLPVVAGFSTHPHWDHLLWHPRFGDVPRYATPAGADAASGARERAQTMAAESALGIPLDLIGLLTPLPADGGPVPGEIVEHQAHAFGHAVVLLADRRPARRRHALRRPVPLLDPRRPDQVGAYATALDRLGEAARHVDVVVPGTRLCRGSRVAARLAAVQPTRRPSARRGTARRAPEPGVALRPSPVEPGAGPTLNRIASAACRATAGVRRGRCCSERRIPISTMSSYAPRTHACWRCRPSTTNPAFSYARIAPVFDAIAWR